MTDFKLYAAQHAKLFPLADLDSQIDKLADEMEEYKAANTKQQQIKELADCVICVIGIYRFTPFIAQAIYSGLKSMYMTDAETKVAIDNEVARKWQINLGRTWKFDPVTKKYQHTGIDGNE